MNVYIYLYATAKINKYVYNYTYMYAGIYTYHNLAFTLILKFIFLSIIKHTCVVIYLFIFVYKLDFFCI